MHDILIEESVFAENDRLAEENREYFKKRGIFVVNLASPPGSGKTGFIEKTLEFWGGPEIAVIEGGMETDNDAR